MIKNDVTYRKVHISFLLSALKLKIIFFTYQKIVDRIAEEVVSVIWPVISKFMIGIQLLFFLSSSWPAVLSLASFHISRHFLSRELAPSV